jgi:hypothetical protein
VATNLIIATFSGYWGEITERRVPWESISMLTILAIWGFMRCRAINYTPMLIYLVLIALPASWYIYIENQHTKQDIRCTELSYYMLLCFIQSINYNPFMLNLLV